MSEPVALVGFRSDQGWQEAHATFLDPPGENATKRKRARHDAIQRMLEIETSYEQPTPIPEEP